MLACASLLALASRTAVAVQLRASQALDADAGARATAESAAFHPRYDLHLLKDKDALCLDGSHAAFYFAPAKDFGRDNENKNDWQIAFEGGGWCYGEQECIVKSQTGRGSSNGYTEHYNGFRTLGGFMSDDCIINPTFCHYNKVLVKNCDGTSFTGDQSEPVVATDKDGTPVTLHFKGARILPAVMDALFTKGLRDANDVILTGFSSGGHATLLHADYIHQRLHDSAHKLNKFRAVPISGLFLDHMSEYTDSGAFVDSQSKIYNTEFKTLVELANSKGVLNQRCVDSFEKKEKGSGWKCFLAPNAYSFLQTPAFIVNSGIDEWQISFLNPEKRNVQVLSRFSNISNGNYEHAIESWRSCFLSAGFEKCSEIQVNDMYQFHTLFEHLLKKNSATNGNGAFVHTCPLHDEALDDDNFNNLTVKGKSIQETVTDWWKSGKGDPTSKHTTLDCHLDKKSSVHTCNPSCTGLIDHSN